MKNGIVVVGAGGHAKVCIELLRSMGSEVACCVGNVNSPETCMGVPVMIGDDNLGQLRKAGYLKAFVAIGSNISREHMAKVVTALGYELVNAISPMAIISPTARLGSGIAIMAGAVINAETIVEDLAIINTGATVDHDCRIGRSVHLAPQCGLAGTVVVGARSFLGVGAKVIPNINIGSDVIVGAGGVVISNIGNDITVVGVPANKMH